MSNTLERSKLVSLTIVVTVLRHFAGKFPEYPRPFYNVNKRTRKSGFAAIRPALSI